MGKTQSKSQVGLCRKRDGSEGDCFVVNAHFNPLAMSDSEDTLPLNKADSEITLSVSSCASKDVEISSPKVGFADDSYPLQVVLPPEKCVSSEKPEKEMSKYSASDVEGNGPVQGFECDVSVEAGAGCEKQEFIFTLYDLDGRGRFTKEDIAGLVRSIYDAMGASLELQPTVSKTIKVRLTVTPQLPSVKVTEGGDTSKLLEKYQYESVKEKCNWEEKEETTTVGQTCVMDGCNNKTSVPLCGDNEDNCKENVRVPGITFSPHGRIQQELKNVVGLGLLQKQQLLKIIQDNLEKNRKRPLSDEKRRHKQRGHHHQVCERVCGTNCHHESKNGNADIIGDRVCHDKEEHEFNDMSSFGHHQKHISQCEYLCQAGGGGGTDHVCSKVVSPGRPHVCCHARHHHLRHHRSRSHHNHDQSDLGHPLHEAFQYRLLPDVENDDGGLPKYPNHLVDEKVNLLEERNKELHNALYHARSKSYDACYYDSSMLFSSSPKNNNNNNKGSRLPKNVEFNLGSPHHQKHRHREREYQRAMQQVASWIEKEHLIGNANNDSSRTGGNNNNRRSHYHNHLHRHQPRVPPNRQSSSSGKLLQDRSPPLLVERHEHHHVHEHFHHHYHHYHEL